MGDRAVAGGPEDRTNQPDGPEAQYRHRSKVGSESHLREQIKGLEEELYLERCEKNQWLLSLEGEIKRHHAAEQSLYVKGVLFRNNLQRRTR